MRRIIAAGLSVLLLLAGALPAGAADAYRPEPSVIRSGDVSLSFPAIPGFCTPSGDYVRMVEQMNTLTRYVLVLFSCEQMRAHDRPNPMFMVTDLTDPEMVGLSRPELFKILDAYPESAWNASIQKGASEVTEKSNARGMTPGDTTMDFGFTKRGYDDAAFYLAGVILVQGGGRENRGAAAMAITQVRGRTLVLMILGKGDSQQDVDGVLAQLKKATRALLLANGV